MVNFYVRKIKDGTITIDKVPAKYRDAVQAVLDAEEAIDKNNSGE